MADPSEAGGAVLSDPVAFKIIDADDWAGASAAGQYQGSAVDLADGYIHLSTQAQLVETVRKHYAGQHNLLLLTVDLQIVGEAVRWEPSRGGALFPHIYGPLVIEAVREVRGLDIDTDGTMRILPDPRG